MPRRSQFTPSAAERIADATRFVEEQIAGQRPQRRRPIVGSSGSGVRKGIVWAKVKSYDSGQKWTCDIYYSRYDTSNTDVDAADWTASGEGDDEYYISCTTRPAFLQINDSEANEGTTGSLSPGEWGYSTAGGGRIYVKLSDSSDPGAQADGYIDFRGVKSSADLEDMALYLPDHNASDTTIINRWCWAKKIQVGEYEGQFATWAG